MGCSIKAISVICCILLFCMLFQGCSGRGGDKVKPMLSVLEDAELEKEAERVPYAAEYPIEVKRYLIRRYEQDIDYKWDDDYSDEQRAFYGGLRNVVIQYYGGQLPVITDYAVEGKPRYQQTGARFSELEDHLLVRTLMEHFVTYPPIVEADSAPTLDDIRGFIAALERDPKISASEVFPSLAPESSFAGTEELFIEELRRAVKLYYGNDLPLK